MVIMRINAYYYQQFDADHSQDVPAESYLGWQKGEIEIDLDHTALVIMHAWDCGTEDMYPGWYRHVEYIPRANAILKNVFPRLLEGVRASRLQVVHVVAGGRYYKDLPGYKKTLKLAGKAQDHYQSIKKDPARKKLDQFRTIHAGQGLHNIDDIKRGFKALDFPREAIPKENEFIVDSSAQLFKLCNKMRISHLIYIGFAINWCLLLSPGGMVDMSRHGIMCSTIRQAVIAVENAETARNELCKEIALWRVAFSFGFIFDLEALLSALKKNTLDKKN